MGWAHGCCRTKPQGGDAGELLLLLAVALRQNPSPREERHCHREVMPWVLEAAGWEAGDARVVGQLPKVFASGQGAAARMPEGTAAFPTSDFGVIRPDFRGKV